ncbi:prepilin peptidase [Haloechinothrix sp. YIM 98757]|uniref:Prepilin peptidase n=1 Tax=Haloechinothrix aidingensis TaxID=2752311 RepID=A0A838AD92_9PSEU|nr:prepilin peptidase [Haloechinothrix aidingensis]MBA0127266.1 prepilin peptidase [Haloechinothrix aidingensis]
MATALAAAVLAVVAHQYVGSASVLAWFWLSCTGIVLGLVDVRCRRLPHAGTVAMAVGGVACLAGAAVIESAWPRLMVAMLSGVGVYLVAAAVQLLAPGHTGGGDTALYGALALYVGWFGWSGLALGLLLAVGLTGVVGVFVGIARRTAAATFPAGPSLITGAITAIVLA